jgi:hypothetical protein
MPATPDLSPHDESPPEIVALRREVSTLIHRWQQAGISLHELAMVLATAGCQGLGHAMGHVSPPEGPEIIQDIMHELQRQAESCYFSALAIDYPAHRDLLAGEAGLGRVEEGERGRAYKEKFF